MRHGTLLALIASASMLAGCAGWRTVGPGNGDVRLEPLPPDLARRCAHPAEMLDRSGTVAAAEVSLGRIGDELIDCEAKRAAIVGAWDQARAALAPAGAAR